MLQPLLVPGYELSEIIHEGVNTTIYRGVALQNQQPVILKVLKADYPSLEALARLKHEYKTVCSVDLPGVVKVLRLETHKNRLALVFQDEGGHSLKQLLQRTLELHTFISIAIQLAQALAELHSHHIIHKDIKPANIIINPETGIVKLTDFSIACRLDRETPQPTHTNQLEGTLAYMSPEQTGRMNRTLDYRTDFYSLGVTFYEMLTGQLPFGSNDPLELVYSHIAKLPVPIEQLNPEIPSSIASIIMKLMAKNAEDRYQSAWGLKADLEFVHSLLTEDPDSLQEWREKLQAALGNNGQIIVDVIPDVELIIGKQPPVQKLGLAEAQNRFNRVFQEFVRVFTQKEHPLVIFLDDLQWADVASLKLMQLLICDPDSQYLLLIGAYRDNEVETHGASLHPLMQTVEEIQQTGTVVDRIVVKPLDLTCVNKLLCDTLAQSETDQIQELASLLFNKTGGNPFFLTQMLKTLQQEQLLMFDTPLGKGGWRWNIEQIQTVGITDLGVVELMARNICKLPKSTQACLTYAACIGDRFKLDVLAIATQKSVLEIADDLFSALQQGLILPLNKDYKVPLLFDKSELQQFNFDDTRLEYKFLHDRVQQAAYSLISDEQKQATHSQIGQLLLNNTPTEQLLDNIFDIVNQLNVGIPAQKPGFSEKPGFSKKEELAQLNLMAGRKAKASAAYEPAVKYLRTAMELLTIDSWDKQYDLTLTLHKERAEVEFISSNFEQAETLTYTAIKQAKSNIDKAELYNLLVVQYTFQTKFEAAIKAGRKGLRLLGIRLPKDNVQAAVDAEIVEVKQNLGNQEIASSINQLEMVLEDKKVACKLLVNLDPATYITSDTSLYIIISIKVVNLSLKYGNISESVKGYCNYGIILGSILGDYQSGYEFGSHAYKLSEHFNDKSQQSKSRFVLANFLHCWVKHIKGVANINNDGYQAGWESGELLYAGYNLFGKVCNLFFQGVELESLLSEISVCFHSDEKIKHYLVTETILAVKLAILDLLGNKLEQKEPQITGSEFLEQCERHQNLFTLAVYYICKCQSLYIINKLEEALSYALRAEKLLGAMIGFTTSSEYYFYYSLILTDLFSTVESEIKEQYWKQLHKHLQQMKIWADNCPENFLHKYLLIEAELARISGNCLEAIDLYDQAIESAQEQEFIQIEALANELAAKFWLSKNKQEFAQLYMTKAYYCYLKWGATAKVQQLESLYPYLAVKTTDSLSKDTTTSSTTGNSQSFDLLTVVKASQALSEEIVVENLLEKLIALVRENAGAEKVIFLDKQNEQLFIEASLIGESNVTVCQSLPITKFDALPKNLINYVNRTQTPLLLDDATQNKQFNFDPYIVENKPKSVLVLPIMHQSTIVGILYLENNLITGAFTKDRLEVLLLIASQAAISLENARFYSTLEKRVAQRTQELQNALEELRRTQLQMIQSEKMSSLGQLVAGIAHEINNPVSFIYGNLAPISEYVQSLLELVDLYLENTPNPLPEFIEKASEIDLEYIREDVPNLVNSLRTGAARIRDIVQSLRNFSRLDEAVIKDVDIHEGIENTLMILTSQLGKIQVVKEYDRLPKVQCYAGEINQVFMSLLTNAIDALEESVACGEFPTPTIQIRTEMREDNQVAIRISDNGVGMTEEVKSKIFDPFFTTKPVGKANGLGLSISYQIVVEKHNGNLICQSVPGEGTEFTILLPCE